MEIGTCGCAPLTAVLFSWASQMMDRKGRTAWMPGLAGIEIGFNQWVIAVPQICGVTFVRLMLICLWMRLQAQKWGSACFQVCASSWDVVTVVPFASD